jgi:hypothetical protein
VAKVEMILKTDDYFDLSISEVKVRRYNKKGYSQCSARRGCCGCGIYENWEVNAGQWTLIIVEVDPPMR